MANIGGSSHFVDPRFGPPLDDSDVATLNASTQSKNTSKRNKWALRIFQSWLALRHPGFTKALPDFSVDEMKDYISRFIHGVRRNDGGRYPNTTLVSIIAGLNSTTSSENFFFRDSRFK